MLSKRCWGSLLVLAVVLVSHVAIAEDDEDFGDSDFNGVDYQSITGDGSTTKDDYVAPSDSAPGVGSPAEPRAAAAAGGGGGSVSFTGKIVVKQCMSGAFSAQFTELKEALEIQYPQLLENIHSEKYQPSKDKQMVASVVGSLQLWGMILLLFGETMFKMMKMEPPPLYGKLIEKKTTVICVLFGCNMLAQRMTATGAFEVLLMDPTKEDPLVPGAALAKTLFSKMASDRLPAVSEVVMALKAAGSK